MSVTAADNYAIYYADKLWNLLPAVYRVQDTDQFFTANGPLREMVNRIGATAAAMRRSIDRLWEDQSIESCDDWVIPYIAGLLDTRLVLGLDARGQRLDVANTIDYRRRKGTLAVLEQIASDITGWDAKAVEFFRRLGRTRHLLDPPIGPASAAGSDTGTLQRAEGLVGPLTRTRIGGFANLRHVYGAGKSRSAFDEFSHTGDTRAGQGLLGWHAIPHLGIFVWRLLSLQVGPVTPVPVAGCPGWYTFDPTGRDAPLFAQQRDANAFGDEWVSPSEGQLPGPISQQLLNADIAAGAAGLQLYPLTLSVTAGLPPLFATVSAAQVTLRPARGRFNYEASPPGDVFATYCYGFPSTIGAGPYDRRGQQVTVPTPAPITALTGGGPWVVGAPPDPGTIVLSDSFTYTGVPDLSIQNSVTLQAGNNQRPLLQLQAPWVIEGSAADSCLSLDGLLVSGHDIVLRGTFGAVTLTCCTLDPGSATADNLASDAGVQEASPPLSPFQIAANGAELRPTRLWIEATITTLTVDRCVLGPIRSRNGGNVETITLSNSIVQGIRSAALGPLVSHDVKDPARLIRALQLGLDPVSAMLRALDPGIESLLGPPSEPPLATPVSPLGVLPALLTRLNGLIADPPLPAAAFNGTPLSSLTAQYLSEASAMQPAPVLNRLLLEDAYPLELADAALAFADGTLNLSRCTLLGRLVAHELEASECILQQLTTVDDLQCGCVRFTACASGSAVPRQYESVAIAQGAPLFTSTDFGQPGYGQLLPTADQQIVPTPATGGAPANTISAGATDGSEMGAYARDKNPIRANALLLKLQEYMPAALVPVIVDVT